MMDCSRLKSYCGLLMRGLSTDNDAKYNGKDKNILRQRCVKYYIMIVILLLTPISLGVRIWLVGSFF